MDEIKKKLVEGLTSSPKYLPTWYSYDEIGSVLHDKSTAEVTGYYFLQSQINVLEKHTKEMVMKAPYDFTLADLGCGSCSKTKYFLDELLKKQSHVKFFPLDISKEFLMATADKLSKEYGDELTIIPIAKDYDSGLEELGQDRSPKIIVWFGSIINLTYEEQVAKLKQIADILTDQCYLIFSVDITQDKDTIIKSHLEDPGGIKSAFWLNSVQRLNREEGANIDLNKLYLKHDFIKDTTPDSVGYFLAYVQAKEAMDVKIPGLNLDLHLEKDECIHVANGTGAGSSHKYTREQICSLTRKAGLQLTDTWIDEEEHAMFCKCKLT